MRKTSTGQPATGGDSAWKSWVQRAIALLSQATFVDDEAAATTFTPAGSITATDVQLAIQQASEDTDVVAATVATLQGLQRTIRVRAATTASVTISTAFNAGDTIDGVVLAAGDLVLAKDQSTGSQNGIYVVGASPARHSEFDTYDDHPGGLVIVMEGTTNADTMWLCTSDKGGTLDTTSIAYQQTPVSGGSFTPTVSFATPGTSSFVYTNQSGTWRRWGSLVYVRVRVTFTPTLGTASGIFHIEGLPFTSASIGAQALAIASLTSTSWSWPGSATQIIAAVQSSNTTIRLIGLKSVTAETSFTISNLTNAASHDVVLSGVYVAA